MEVDMQRLVLNAVCTIVNLQFRADSFARRFLEPWVGKTFTISAGPFRLDAVVSHGGYWAICAPFELPDVQINIDLASLPLKFLPQTAQIERVHINGDAAFAQALANSLQSLRTDVDHVLGLLTQNVFLFRTVRFYWSLALGALILIQRGLRMTANYLVDERKILARRTEFDQSRDRMGLLQQRLLDLETRVGVSK